MPTIGAEIKAARRRKHLSQPEVALMCDLNLRTYQRIERGNNPRLDDILVVCAFLSLPLGQAVRHPQRDAHWVPPPVKV